MHALQRALRFLIRYAAHPVYIVTYLANYWRAGFALGIDLYSESQVTEEIRRGRSLIRFGDGEINLLLGLRNHYHGYDPKLRRMLKEIVKEYDDKKPYILAVPKFLNYSNAELRQVGRLNLWMPFKTMFMLLFPKQARYTDAHCFYYTGYFERFVAPAIEGKRVIFVTNEATLARQRTNPAFPWKDSIEISTPNEEALAVYETVRAELYKTLSQGRNGEFVTLISMGPAGKYLAKELAEAGYQAIDLGKAAEVIYTEESIEWMILGAL